MGANKLETFTIETVNRNDIHGADYNPRKISETAKKKLRKFLKENGLWSPLVLNKRTMTLVSGHQRLEIMDALLRAEDYDLTMSVVDVDEKTEASGNVFMNNPSAQGEWDIGALQDITKQFPDIDFEADLGFDLSDIEVMRLEREQEKADGARLQARIRTPMEPPEAAAKGIPFGASGIPFTTKGIPFGASGIPFTTKGIPFGTSGIPFTTKGIPFTAPALRNSRPFHPDYPADNTVLPPETPQKHPETPVFPVNMIALLFGKTTRFPKSPARGIS